MKIHYNSIQVLLIVIISYYTNTATAQQPTLARNSIYADATSKGAYYSINYDRVFRQGERIASTYRVGLSILNNAIAFPLGINFLTGQENDHIEFGLTIVPYIENYTKLFSAGNLSDKKIYIIPGAGYRFQKPGGGLFFKAIVAPIIFLDPPSDDFWKMDGKVYTGGSIGAGISF
jgi:hypothetical protein